MLRVSPDLPFPHKNRASSARGPSEDAPGCARLFLKKGITMPRLAVNMHEWPVSAADASSDTEGPTVARDPKTVISEKMRPAAY